MPFPSFPRHTEFFRVTFAASVFLIANASGQDATVTLAPVVVESEGTPIVQEPFLPAVEGVKINSGKKSSVIDLDAFPKITNNNYRQALAKTPGLYLSEETTPLVSIGYRGLDPGRVQFTQVLKDGIPIHADQFGYPEAYYTPPLDTVDRIEFLRGGAALMYGPQPGGSLNYVTHRPQRDRPFSFGTTNTVGSDSYYSTFSYIDGTSGRLGYYGYFNHRQGEGFRDNNSDFELFAGNLKLVLDADTDSRWILSLEGYEEEHDEPGGLTFDDSDPLAVLYNKNRDAASRLYDVFKLKRYSASLQWERDFSQETKMVTSAWGTYYSRYSSRQGGGGFGTLPTGPQADTTTTEHQEFYTIGFESRLRHDYQWLGGEHTIAGGFQFYHTDSPREDRRGKSQDDLGGQLRKDSDRSATYLPIFVENKFSWGNFSITPGIRLENIWQSVKENRNLDKTDKADPLPLGDNEDSEFVPLLGLGISYKFSRAFELYGNASQSYRPKIYTQAVPTGGTALVPADLNESSAWQYDVGFRGQAGAWANWDVSAFLLDFDDQIGNVTAPGGSTVANVGRAQHYGVEMAAEVDLIGLADELLGNNQLPDSGKDKDAKAVQLAPTLVERFGSFSLYANAMLLDAEFVSGPLDGNTPRYAADYLVRAGFVYRAPQDRFRIAMLGTMVGESYANDDNTAQRFVPAHTVWDLTAEVKVYKDIVTLNAGVNNLFNEDYYSRITDTGIDPAYGRNFYVGASLKF